MNQNEAPTGFELPIPNESSSSEADGTDRNLHPSVMEGESNHAFLAAPVQGAAQAQQPPVDDGSVKQASVATQPSVDPLSADDADLIEKEWVTKAKQIVSLTKHDPYRQNQEMSKVKADYLKKRYDKNIKTEGI